MTEFYEDPDFGGHKPYIDLTPSAQWGNCIKDEIGDSVWQAIEDHAEARVGRSCELCKASPKYKGFMGHRAHQFKIECRFEHDVEAMTAILRRVLHVCIPCSWAIHLRHAQLITEENNYGADWSPENTALKRLAYFHNMSRDQIRIWLSRELKTWYEREQIGYPLYMEEAIAAKGTKRLWGTLK